MALGARGGCAVLVDGDMQCWRDAAPAPVAHERAWAEVAATALDVCARDDEGRVFCWDPETPEERDEMNLGGRA